MKLRLPHPLILLLYGVAISAVLTWILPAGEYQRRADAATGRQVVIAGTYAATARAPVGPFAAILSVPRGIVAGADVMLTVLFVGGAFALLDATGALSRLVAGLVGGTQSRRRQRATVVIGVSLAFATLGALENMQEEIIALVPVLVLLSRGLGFGAITAVAMSAGAACVGAAFGPTNPFQTGIALRFAELPARTMPAVRFGLLFAAVSAWIAWTLWNTSRDDRADAGAASAIDAETRAAPAVSTITPTTRDVQLLLLCVLPFVPYVYGVMRLDWGFNELSAIFLLVGLCIGVLSGMSLSEGAAAFLKASEGLLAAGLYVGVARAMSVVLTDGHVMDTIVYGLAAPLQGLSGATVALSMIPMQALLHFPVPSVSGQAVLTMPLMAPLADLSHVSRDAAVIAYQTGAGLMDMITPTNGALLAILASARVPYARWLRFVIPGALLVSVVGVIGILIAAH